MHSLSQIIIPLFVIFTPNNKSLICEAVQIFMKKKMYNEYYTHTLLGKLVQLHIQVVN